MIMVYDVNDRDSFEHLKDFSQLVQEYAKAVEAKFIVGNKVDDSSNRAVTVDEAKVLKLFRCFLWSDDNSRNSLQHRDAITLK